MSRSRAQAHHAHYNSLAESSGGPYILGPLTAAVEAFVEPISTEDLVETQRTGTCFVRYQGDGRPTFQGPGLERLRQNRLNERFFQEGRLSR